MIIPMYSKQPNLPDLKKSHRPRISGYGWLGIAALTVLFGVVALGMLSERNDRVWWILQTVQARVHDAFFTGGETLPAAEQPELQPTPQHTAPAVAVPSFGEVTPTPTDVPTAAPEATATPVVYDVIDPPDFMQLEGFRFEYQGPSNCGPTTLAMDLSYWNWEGDQYTIADVLKPNREDKNVRWDELVYYVKNYAGWLDALFRVGGDFETIELFIANDYPVVIETGYYVNTLWVGHYLLVTGYDREARMFRVHDATGGPDRLLTYEEVDELWQHFNRLYILVYPVGDGDKVLQMLGENADEELNRARALAQAETDVASQPENAFAWHNLGNNLSYFERYEEAAEAFDRAREIGLPRRMLFYQFGTYHAYFNTGRYQDVYDLANFTLDYRPDLEENYFWRGWASHMLGDTPAAIADFNRALEINPNFNDALLALQYFGAR